jgi:TolB-like protein
MLALQDMAAAGSGDQDKDLTTVAVLDFKPERVSRETAVTASDSLSLHLSESGEFRMWSRSKVAQVTTSIVEDYHSIWTCEDIECAVRVGRELGSNTVVIGSVSRLGQLVTVSAQAVDVNSESVVEAWSAESLIGEEGVPAAVRDLARQIVKAKARLPRGELRYRPARQGDLVLEDFETSFSLGAGLGLHGHESSKRGCDFADTSTACYANTAEIRWQAEIGLWARLKGSRWCLGLGAGAVSSETTWMNSFASPSCLDIARGEDSGFNFHVYPRLGGIIFESKTARIMAFGGVGYRDFSDESNVDNSFAAAGLGARILPVRMDLTYWHGFDSESLLRDMVTMNLGFGFGF